MDVLKVALAVVAGLGGAVALVVSYVGSGSLSATTLVGEPGTLPPPNSSGIGKPRSSTVRGLVGVVTRRGPARVPGLLVPSAPSGGGRVAGACSGGVEPGSGLCHEGGVGGRDGWLGPRLGCLVGGVGDDLVVFGRVEAGGVGEERGAGVDEFVTLVWGEAAMILPSSRAVATIT